MTSVYKYNNSIIIENGAIGISPSCCCGCVPPCCNYVRWTYTLGECNNVPEPQVVDSPVDAGSCYSYFVWEDWDCQNPLVGRDCGEGAQCNVYARVKVTCSDRDEARGGCGINCTLGPIQYRAADNDQWGGDSLAACDCANSFGSLTAEVCQDIVQCCANGQYQITFGNIDGIANIINGSSFITDITVPVFDQNGNFVGRWQVAGSCVGGLWTFGISGPCFFDINTNTFCQPSAISAGIQEGDCVIPQGVVAFNNQNNCNWPNDWNPGPYPEFTIGAPI